MQGDRGRTKSTDRDHHLSLLSSQTIGVRDFVCIHGPVKISTFTERCSGVLKAYMDNGSSVSSNVKDHIIYVEKQLNTSIQNAVTIIKSRSSVNGIVYLSAPVFNEQSTQISSLLNNSRSFKIATFDFNSNMDVAMTNGQLHYSTSSLIYLQTLIPILLLYLQVRLFLLYAMEATLFEWVQ